MIFNSLDYAIFLPIVLVLYYALATRAQNAMLLLASYIFYGWWDYRFLLLLWISTVVDFYCAKLIERSSGKRRIVPLIVSCATNLGILGFFKYFNFFVDSSAILLSSLGLDSDQFNLHIVLPMGISFYTFQTLSYTIDVYRGQLRGSRSLLTFALYVAYFPQLVAGPIERAGHLLPQLDEKRRVLIDQLSRGSFLILLGWFKKVGIADAIGPLVDARFDAPHAFSGANLLCGGYLFAIQIYCDFSGYSDMARGSSKLLGIDLMLNFKQPYFASSITEFWRRWHISLSSWLRDYLYIPLGGNRFGKVITYRNLMITMLLGGLWHGASWTFVLWGALHGLYLSLDRRFGRGNRRIEDLKLGYRWGLGVLATFHLVCAAWIFFRAQDFATAWAYLSGIATWETITKIPETPLLSGRMIVLIATLIMIDCGQAIYNDECFVFRFPAFVRGCFYAALIVITLVLGEVDTHVPFIYFQF